MSQYNYDLLWKCLYLIFFLSPINNKVNKNLGIKLQGGYALFFFLKKTIPAIILIKEIMYTLTSAKTSFLVSFLPKKNLSVHEEYGQQNRKNYPNQKRP